MTNKKIIWTFVAILFLLLSLILSFFTYKIIISPDYFQNIILQKEKYDLGLKDDEANLVSRHIDGVLVQAGEENYYPLGIMIDNHIDARPCLGLSGANLVIEAEAEGSITRYLAFFADNKELAKIGPIRSARPYFIDYARELSALYAHVGGSPEALALMKKDNVLHINEFYNGDYFWRADNNFAPHNVYISSANLYKYLEKKNLKQGKFFPWIYKDDLSKDKRAATSSIKIKFGDEAYNVAWEYDYANNSYLRYLAGEIHREADNQVISAKNVAVVKVKGEIIDELMRLELNTIGTGTAIVCLDGECSEGTWKKNSSTARIRFYNKDNNEFNFNRGTTWIEIVRNGKEIIY
ncbi:MAG: DUF3048 domain-containing protein [Patescibacteria group bacterium]|nr:DUF3048 domain-containing protein [Patescibacteria group bacterium]